MCVGGSLFDLALSCTEGVEHEGEDGHRSYAAGHGGDIRAFGSDLVKGDVAAEFPSFLVFGCFHAIDPDVDHNSPFFDHIGFNEVGNADGGDQDIGRA